MYKILKICIIISIYNLIGIFLIFSESAEKQNENKFTYDNYAHKYELRNGVKKDSNLVNKRIKMIERIPDSVQLIVDMKDPVTIIFFNGCLTDNPDLLDKKGSKPRGYKTGTLDMVMMCHYKSKLYLGVNGDYYDNGTDYTLHEYGHVFDDKIGNFFYGKPLSSLDKVAEIIKKKEFLLNEYFHHPREFIAFSVYHYYSNNFTKKYLKNNFNEMYELLKEIEEKSIASAD